ncbi:MAG: T9SS type A sorting domain-containing protein [Ferruginibacter sp.]
MTKFLPLLFSVLLFSTGKISAQIFYSQTFDGTGGSTSGGAGTYTFPPGFFLRNVDNLTPDVQVNAIDDAWERLADTIGDSAAISTSFYTPPGRANDFMWTPPIALTGNSISLSWNAIAYDGDFADGYEVRIMTVEPTGGTGVIGNQLTSSTLLLSIPAEDTLWTPRILSLNAYTGQTVYIGFRNNSNDKFVLAIDDILIQNNTVVPLNSLSLAGNFQNGKNFLKWSVVGTDNKYDLSLQNSADGRSWQDIYQAVSTPGKTEFSYSHSITAAKSFYRVKAVGPTGRVYVSNTILVSQRSGAPVILYPTPASSKVNIQGNLKNSTVLILDASGKTMVSELVQDDSRAFDVSRWPTGVYFVKIITKDNYTFYKKLVVQH